MISPVHTWIAKKTGLFKNLNPETLHSWQMEKLKVLIQYANKNTNFYKGKLPNTNDITKLPFTTPVDIVNDPFAFLAIPQSLIARVTTLANSGTTRLKKRIFSSQADLERTIDFFMVGMSTIVHKGQHAKILISNKTENSLGCLLKESLSRIGLTSEIPGVIKSANMAKEYAKDADCLIGMPAELLYLCRIAPELRPGSVLLAADYISQAVIDSIKESWKCQVFSHYGHTEFGFGSAVDCIEHDGYHLRDADLIFEIINPQTGQIVKPGEHGEIVITTLSNEAMPLIRYRTGNISSILNKPCNCGSELFRLGKIKGRIESNISIGNGETLSIHELDEIIFANPEVRGFNASLHLAKNKNTLLLTIDSFGKIDLNPLLAKQPQKLKVEIKYGNADPYVHREKRRIHLID